MKVIHLTTLHSRDDTRIVLKELDSLVAAAAGEVAVYVQDGLGDGLSANGQVPVVDTGQRPNGRLSRAVLGNLRMWRAIRAARPKIAHFHDPELMIVGLLLKMIGIKVIYDVHEDLPRQICGMAWVPAWLRKPAAACAGLMEQLGGTVFDAIVAATPAIARRFPPAKTVLVQNFPLLNELTTPNPKPMTQRLALAAYVGGLSAIRGAHEMVRAFEKVPRELGLQLGFAGAFSPRSLSNLVAVLDGWQHVNELGWLNRTEVATLLGEARMGLVLFHPLPNHIEAQPNKLFEYMSAGLPVVVSDFPLWRDIVGRYECGLLVNPLDPDAIGAAMAWILTHPDEAEAMGRRGRLAVENHFSWRPEARKLLALYQRLGFGARVFR